MADIANVDATRTALLAALTKVLLATTVVLSGVSAATAQTSSCGAIAPGASISEVGMFSAGGAEGIRGPTTYSAWRERWEPILRVRGPKP